MDIYIFSLALGGVGLGVMAIGGLTQQGHHHGQQGHGAHHGVDHGAHGAHHAAHHGHDAHHAHHLSAVHASAGTSALLWTLGTPRLVFSVLLGFGAAGMLLRSVVPGAMLVAIALGAGIAFERLVVKPLFTMLLGFASAPALTLESTLLDEARAASGFDANGEGLVAVDVDGQIVQVLGTLRQEDRALGVRVRAGDRLRIEDVDGERHRCTVSYLGK